MAGAFALACGLLIHLGLSAAAYVVEGIFLAAVLALTLGGFCLGSFVHHLLRGRGAFARQTPALCELKVYGGTPWTQRDTGKTYIRRRRRIQSVDTVGTLRQS